MKEKPHEQVPVPPPEPNSVDPFHLPTQDVLMAEPGAVTPPEGLDRTRPAPRVSAQELLTASGVGRYRIERVISQGGMGTVYQVMDVNCRRRVAMKILRPDGPMRPDELLRFVEEAQISSQLEHPNIVPVHELGLDDQGQVFYTMKYVQGVTLTEVLDCLRRGDPSTAEQYPLSRLLTIFQKACDAVAFAHSKGVVHRDLKPENIMIGEYGEVLVMDWGLAKALSGQSRTSFPVSGAPIDSVRQDTQGLHMKTLAGWIMGTPGYMAPEQARTGEVDVRSDIYSLGAILYSILTLRPPIEGKELTGLLEKIGRGDIRPPLAHNEPPPDGTAAIPLAHCPGQKIPAALSEIAMKALSLDPKDRYPSVRNFQADLEAYQDGLVWHLVVEEDFSSPDWESRWKFFGGQWEIKEGELRLYGGEPQFLLLNRPLGGDVRIEFECHLESIYLNDIACFMSSIESGQWKEIPPSGYEFKFGGFSNSMNLLTRADRRLWAQAASPLERGKRYRVLAERVGARLRMVVNGQEIFRVLDGDPLSGADRTAVGLLGWMADIRYRWIRISSLGAPMKADLLDTAERQLQKGRYITAMDLFQDAYDSFPDAPRKERARRGWQMAGTRMKVQNSLSYWRGRLDEAWPGLPFALRMENERLTLDISQSGISSLEPLSGMPLSVLYCGHNQISSLEPLRAMPLVMLNCDGNPITSLEPLKGMPLVNLFCEGCPLDTLEPLRESRLVMLNCGGSNLRTGLQPLRGMNLNWLSCWNCNLEDLEPLREMCLSSLYCDGNRISSLEPLKGMPLGTLICGGNKIESLAPLRGMPLTTLHCTGNRIRDLEPLRGMKLNILSCHCNQIASLAPLQESPLSSLACGRNPLSSLDPIAQSPPFAFLYESNSLPDEEIERVRSLWAANPRWQAHARQAELLLALRKGDRQALRQQALPFLGRHFLFIPKFMRWEEARAYCETLGGHLVTITSREKNNFLVSMIPGGSWFWMGLKTSESGHAWVTGEPFEFSNFVDPIRERIEGEKVFCSGAWYSEVYSGVSNCFVMEWDD